MAAGERAKARANRPFPGRFFWIASALNLALLLGLWFSHLTYAERHWLPTLLANVPQHPYGLATLGLLLWALLRRSALGLLVNLPALGVWLLGLMGLAVAGWLPRGQPVPGAALRVMTFNVEQNLRLDGATMARAVLRYEPQVVLLQEVRGRGGFSFERFRQEFPGWHAAQAFEVGILSRYPLEQVRVHPMPGPGSRRKILEAVVDVGGSRLTVFNVHYITTTLVNRRDGRPPLESFASEALVRRLTTEKLLELARDSPYPVVLGGDFNMPPRIGLYRDLSAELTDVFAASGRGFGYTWNSRYPLLRIDYLWVRGLEPLRSWVAPLEASDHRPLLADLQLPRGP